MSVSKLPHLKEKQRQNTKKLSLEAQNGDQLEAKHEGVAGRSASKKWLGSKEKHVINVPKAKKKNFVIPRKNNQAKELLQSQHFDSREVKDLLRHVKLSFRHQHSANSFKFEKVEFVNNEKLSQKYAEKKQELRMELPKNRELDEKFAFLYTQSRSKAKLICQSGLQTGHCQLTALGDPKLGIYLCRYADVVYKRPLDEHDSGYLLVFNVMKGRVKGISGGNPEQQPTPHHDCHVSKQFTNLSSIASHTEAYGASQLYFYEIDENSEDFHAKQPRHVLPYAVLTFSIAKPEDLQTMTLNDKPQEKNQVQRHDTQSKTEENTVSTPQLEDKIIENTQSAFNVSWTGQLFYRNKFVAFINLLSYSKKKLLLPDYVDQRLNICKKISHENLKSLYQCPIFRNGKPSSTGVSKEFGSNGKFIYYEMQPVTQQKEKYEKLLSYFVKENIVAILEYYGGSVHMYIMATSQLTHDTGITDEKSPSILHALVHIKRLRPFPLYQEIQQPTTNDETSSSEECVKQKCQEFFEKKYRTKSQKRHSKIPSIPSLLSKEITPYTWRSSDQTSSKRVEDSKSRNQENAKPGEYKSSHRSESSSSHEISHNRYKWTKPKSQSSSSSDYAVRKNVNQEQPKSVTKEQFPKGQTLKAQLSSLNTSSEQHPGQSLELQSSENRKKEPTINLEEVQRLIEQLRQKGTSLSVGFKDFNLTHLLAGDSRLQSKPPSNIGEKKSERSVVSKDSTLVPPPIPPPPPPPPPPLPPPLPLSPPLVPSPPPLPSTPGESTETSSTPEATPPPTVSTLSTFNLSAPPQNIRPNSAVYELSSSYLMSPPTVNRKGIGIPGLEPPGSPVFDLIKDKKISAINKTTRGYLGDSTSKSQSMSPLVCPIDISETGSSPVLSPKLNPVTTQGKAASSLAQSSSSAISDSTQPVLSRALTQAEKTASIAMKEVLNILERNAQVQNDVNSEPTEIPSVTNSDETEDFSVKIKSILKTSRKEHVAEIQETACMNKQTGDNIGTAESTVGTLSSNKSSAPLIEELHKDKGPKVVSLEKYRKKSQSSLINSDQTSCHNTPTKIALTNIKSQSPATPELKSGMDLIDNLIAKDIHQANATAKTAGLKLSSPQSKSKDQDKKEEKLKNDTNKLPRKRRRIVTIKRKVPDRQRSGYDNITSDISDDELPDSITSDISDTELPSDYLETVDGMREKGNNSSTKIFERLQSSHHKSQQWHKEDKREFHDHHGIQVRRNVEESDTFKCGYTKRSIDLSKSLSPDVRDRDRKRRRVELEQNNYQKDVHDTNSCDSDSAMSISPINSPVSFEYAATEGTYRSVIASPTRHGNLEITIPQDGCSALGGLALEPRSPTEVNMDSPGTPETAVPAEDFFHANIGYWSAEFTTKGQTTQPTDVIPAYGEMGYLETHDTIRYETANQGDRPYHHGSVSEQGWSTPPSRPYSPFSPSKLVDDNIDDYPTRLEDHIVRGEGYHRRSCRSIGESSGCDSPSYMELRRPFFGTTEDLISSIYNKNTICTEDKYNNKFIERYALQTDDLPGRRQRYYTSQSPYEPIDSPRSLDSMDDFTYDRLSTGRDSPVTPEYMDSKYSLERSLEDRYMDYYRSPSDDCDELKQRISTFDHDLDSYQNKQDYLSDDEPREPHYFNEDEDHYYRDQDLCGSHMSKHLTEYDRDYQSDEESLKTSDYYDHESYHYLDDLAKDDISNTVLEMDNVVCNGINGFPAQLLDLSNYYQGNPAGSLDSTNNQVTNQVSKDRDPRLNTRDPRLNVNAADNSSTSVVNPQGTCTTREGFVQSLDKNEQKVEKKVTKTHPRILSYFYVYNPDNDQECEAMKNYMLKTGALYLDVSNEAKLKSVKGAAIRVLIRGKHKSALHKISNLSKLKCLRNVKFALFNSVEDVDKKTRAYTAIFQYGGVLIPDDFILKRIHPALLEALLRFMTDENVLHQKVFWVMNIRYQAYKKLVGGQRPLTWRDTFVLELLRKYRNNGFVNIINKEYVSEGLSLIQRYLDTAWKQQRDLFTTYRHFIMLSDMDQQRLESEWFRSRGMGFMDIQTFLLAFAGEKKTRQLLSCSAFTENSDTRQFTIMDSSLCTVSSKPTKSPVHSDNENNRHLDLGIDRPTFKTSSSNMVSRSSNFNLNIDIKEARLEILSSINNVKDNLLHKMGGGTTRETNNNDRSPMKSKEDGIPKEMAQKDVLDSRKEGDSSKDKSRSTQFKRDVASKKRVSSPSKDSTWSRTVRSVSSKDYSQQRRRVSPYQARCVNNADRVDRKHAKDRQSSGSHPRVPTT